MAGETELEVEAPRRTTLERKGEGLLRLLSVLPYVKMSILMILFTGEHIYRTSGGR